MTNNHSGQGTGASVPEQALAVPAESVSRLGPTGFDPSREDNGCPYALSNERSIDQAMAWHEGYRAALRWMMEGGR